MFISWSGEQARTVGHAVKDFLETAFASHVETFLSDADLAAGVRFLAAINSNLSDSDLGIVIITRSNKNAPWLLFEAGSLAARSTAGNVIPLLVDLERNELEAPINQFQNVVGPSKESIERLCARIWDELGRTPSEPIHKQLRDQAWPALAAAFKSSSVNSETPLPAKRDPVDVMNEILLGVNSLVQRESLPPRAASVWATSVGEVRDNGDLGIVEGTRIQHQDFGAGTVTGIQGVGHRKIAVVAFDKAGLKKLLLKVAPIVVLLE